MGTKMLILGNRMLISTMTCEAYYKQQLRFNLVIILLPSEWDRVPCDEACLHKLDSSFNMLSSIKEQHVQGKLMYIKLQDSLTSICKDISINPTLVLGNYQSNLHCN